MARSSPHCGSGRSTCGHPCGSRFETEAAGAEGDNVEEPAGHRQVLVEMDHIVLISGRQMHAKSGAQADKGKQSSGHELPFVDRDGKVAQSRKRNRASPRSAASRNLCALETLKTQQGRPRGVRRGIPRRRPYDRSEAELSAAAALVCQSVGSEALTRLGTESLQTPRWRGTDSKFQYRDTFRDRQTP